MDLHTGRLMAMLERALLKFPSHAEYYLFDEPENFLFQFQLPFEAQMNSSK